MQTLQKQLEARQPEETAAMTYDSMLKLLVVHRKKNIDQSQCRTVIYKTSSCNGTAIIGLGFLVQDQYYQDENYVMIILLGDDDHPYSYKHFQLDKRINKQALSDVEDLLYASAQKLGFCLYIYADDERIPIKIKDCFVKIFCKTIENPNTYWMTSAIHDVRLHPFIGKDETIEELEITGDLTE